MYAQNYSHRSSRKSFSSNRPFRGAHPKSFRKSYHSGRGSGGFRGDRIDPSKFINKAVITEEVKNYVPEHAFLDFKIEQALKYSITKRNYMTPTPIQDRAIPHIINGLDLVGIANTGTGKTGAFLIPLINKVLLRKTERVLIIVPTRELALQINEELKLFASGMNIFSVCCVGGSPIGRQISELRRQYSFIIGTPGRLKDLVDRKIIKLSEFKNLVLDEADRMLDMGFVGEMRWVVSLMPKDRQTLFFSATISSEIERLVKEFLKDPVRISVKTGDTPKNVDQDIVKVRGSVKIDVLHNLLNQKEFSKVLVFSRTKHGAEKLSRELINRGFTAESIHGNKSNSKRQRVLSLFKNGRIQIMVATDVAARGLDIADISHVINYDVPATYDDYVHRIGRTGRFNKKGKALTFIE